MQGLLFDRFSLWSVQQALIELGRLDMTTVETVGRAGVHQVNEGLWAWRTSVQC